MYFSSNVRYCFIPSRVLFRIGLRKPPPLLALGEKQVYNNHHRSQTTQSAPPGLKHFTEDRQMDEYERLARFLDDLPGGLPRSESSVELRILRKLFTPEEASLACHLTLLTEDAQVIARRAGLSLAETQRLLDELERKRLIYVFPEEGKPTRYMAQQFVVGFWESQVDRLDRELVELFEDYLPVYADAGLWGKFPQLRTVPVRESINTKTTALPYEQVETVMARHEKFAVANCICRQEMRLIDYDCGKPLETCLVFDSGAEYFVRTERGRIITREEAFDILTQAEKTGLVLQAGNERTPGNICMCCGCCCGVLRGLKRHPYPASQVASPFYAVLDSERCSGCGLCIKRCQMDALTLVDGKAVLNLERCIGCGLCVTNCKREALSLARKPDDQQRQVPRNTVHLFISMARSRGKMRAAQMAHMVTRSAVDRVLSRVNPESE